MQYNLPSLMGGRLCISNAAQDEGIDSGWQVVKRLWLFILLGARSLFMLLATPPPPNFEVKDKLTAVCWWTLYYFFKWKLSTHLSSAPRSEGPSPMAGREIAG